MLRVAAFAMIACLALGGCVSERMAMLVGHPVSEVAHQFGIPSEITQMPDGSRRFVWAVSATGKPPPLPTEFRPVGEIRTQRERYQLGGLPGGACVYALTARWDAARHDWIVNRVLDPSFICL
ncbi:MAG TPA: hypothetical protein VFL92_13690 [Sphingomonas sp.]|nr:hypothetical protein [Sphingomonas sp.]